MLQTVQNKYEVFVNAIYGMFFFLLHQVYNCTLYTNTYSTCTLDLTSKSSFALWCLDTITSTIQYTQSRYC